MLSDMSYGFPSNRNSPNLTLNFPIAMPRTRHVLLHTTGYALIRPHTAQGCLFTTHTLLMASSAGVDETPPPVDDVPTPASPPPAPNDSHSTASRSPSSSADQSSVHTSWPGPLRYTVPHRQMIPQPRLHRSVLQLVRADHLPDLRC